jgi:hypothetical protein
LNDSIKTTEFLEENHNAEIAVEAFNFDTHVYEPIPLPEETTGTEETGLRDTYRSRNQTGRHQYEKSDSVFCGLLYSRHISPEGGIKLRLTAHNLQHRDSSGFAWFDYAYLAPGHTQGKININTAPPRVLQALHNVDKELAQNIIEGKDSSGRPHLHPYKNIGDVLDVKNMTPEIFTKICNLITTRSDQFRVHVIAESLDDINSDGAFDHDSGDKVLSRSELNALVDRSPLAEDGINTTGFNIKIIQ